MPDSSSDPCVHEYDRVILDPVHRRWYGSSKYYNVGWWDESIRSQAEASAALMERLLAHAGDGLTAALDVGCGLGATTSRVKVRWPDARVVGINLSQLQVAHCRSHVPDCEFEQMDATALAFPGDSFDLVTCVEAAFHFDTREAFLREAFRVLRPGGRLLLADMLLTASQVAATVSLWNVNRANSLPGPHAYAATLETVGFEDVQVDDVTDATWRAWLVRINEWLCSEHELGRVPRERMEQWRSNTPALRDSVSHYLLARCTKPRDT